MTVQMIINPKINPPAYEILSNTFNNSTHRLRISRTNIQMIQNPAVRQIIKMSNKKLKNPY